MVRMIYEIVFKFFWVVNLKKQIPTQEGLGFTQPYTFQCCIPKEEVKLNLHETDLLFHLTWHCSSIYEYLQQMSAKLFSNNKKREKLHSNAENLCKSS